MATFHQSARACVSSRQILLRVASITHTSLPLVGDVSQLKSSRQVEVELHGTALVLTLQGIEQGDINLGAVESTITGVELPLSTGLLSKGLEGLLKFFLGRIPGGNITNVLFGSGGELELECEAENSVNAAQKVESRLNFLSDLSCYKKCEHRPAGNDGLGSDPTEHQRTRFGAECRNQPSSRVGPFAYLEDGKGLDVTSGGDVRTSAQIDEGTTSVDSTLGAIRYSLLDEVLLVLAVLKHLKKLLLGHLETLKGLLLLDDAIFLLNILSHVRHIVVESRRILGRGTVAEVASEASLSGLSENMSRRVPEYLLSFGVVEVEEFNLAALLERSSQIPQLTVNSGDDSALEKGLGNVPGNGTGSGLP
ncbi:hypothetical protein HG531_013409 [Fusarium graminearum]|nr:hypothetical protein HG531_013409 [Fusarium graminearum]